MEWRVVSKVVLKNSLKWDKYPASISMTGRRKPGCDLNRKSLNRLLALHIPRSYSVCASLCLLHRFTFAEAWAINCHCKLLFSPPIVPDNLDTTNWNSQSRCLDTLMGEDVF